MNDDGVDLFLSPSFPLSLLSPLPPLFLTPFLSLSLSLSLSLPLPLPLSLSPSPPPPVSPSRSLPLPPHHVSFSLPFPPSLSLSHCACCMLTVLKRDDPLCPMGISLSLSLSLSLTHTPPAVSDTYASVCL